MMISEDDLLSELWGLRCTKCKNPTGDPNERCIDSPNSSPKIRRLRRIKRKSNSYELFSSEMESNRTGEIDCKISIEECTLVTKTKTNNDFNPAERNGDDGTPRRQSRQSSQTPEYVKRTAKLFETVKVTRGEVENCKNGIGGGVAGKKLDVERVVESSSHSMTEMKQIERETVKISLDSLDGDYGKKPSYLGVSCSNSGYRNVINYDSKLREGFWTANSQRESLVLCSSRMRESSPLRRDYEFKSLNGGEGNLTRTVRVEKEMTTKTGSPSTNGISHSHPDKFVNISTSTKTISTFRNSKDMKEGDGETEQRRVNGIENGEAKTNAETKVNLKQILNGKSEEPYRKGYSNLGFSPKMLKSPEKNCNSFLKSINSFENNCKKTQRTRSSTYPRPESTVTDSNNSIQQRIERLYGPGALAQGFYTGQKPNWKVSDKPEDQPSDGVVEPVPQSTQPVTSVLTKTNLETNNLTKTKPPEVAPTEQCSNGHVVEEERIEDEDAEKNGVYFLKLLKKETDRLERLASFAESELENGENLPEEVSGKLRSAAGKARLLVCQKLNQFEGLCQKNLSEKPSEPFRTTNEDLAGFWDMVMLQVVQVYGVFDELEQLKKNNWKSIPTKKVATTPTTNGQSQAGKTTAKKTTPNSASSAKSEEAKKAREETRRKLLEERRKKMKELKENKIINKETEVEIFAK